MSDAVLQSSAFAEMRRYRQFIVYVVTPGARPGKTDKLPINPTTGRVDASAHNPDIWLSCEAATAAAERMGPGHGVGFVFTERDPFFFIDVDNCVADGQWSPIANWLMQTFAGAAFEVSQSGKGLHIFGKGTAGPHRKKNTAYGLEYYTELRFAALTGSQACGDSGTDHSAALAHVTAILFAPDGDAPSGPGTPAEWTTGPVPEWNGPTDDDRLLERALRSQSAGAAFGNRATFADLFEGRHDALGRAYPHESAPFDASSADAALALHLMFWTGKDCERVERLMRRSALVRPKWDERDDYLRDRTIMNALRMSRDVLTDRTAEPAPGPATEAGAPRPTAVTGATFLTPDQQATLFAGCVYVSDTHRALVPGGTLLKPEQFRVHFGGYAFAMDNANERTTRNAWEAFTESQVLRAPRVDSTCFRPDLSAASVVTQAGRTLVNTYWPVDTPRKTGDAGPFLEHMRRVLPDARDREILLCYMAAIVQYKGIKFQWAPLLQGAEGNGKTLFSRCVAEAVGARYTYWPKASKLAAQFNAWMVGKIFYAVEDIYTPNSRADIIEELKTMITGGDGFEIEGKGADQYSTWICGNFIFNTNHRDALPVTVDTRRFATFYTAQQSHEDVNKAGMTGDYFPKLYDWLRADGFAVVSELLHTYPINPEFNPAGACHRAPRTSTTGDAIKAAQGRIEQEIAEAVDMGRPGFAGGWISSVMFAALLKDLGAKLSINRRREVLQALGFDWHPGLPGGRVHNNVTPDGAKPRLFVKPGGPLAALQGAAIAKAYEAAQAPGAVSAPVPAPPVR